MILRRRIVQVKSHVGLHARPATTIVAKAKKHACTLTIIDRESGATADGRSVISLLSLGAAQNRELELIAEGAGAEELLEELEQLFEMAFGDIPA